jgi:type IV pilus assembly protein PilA
MLARLTKAMNKKDKGFTLIELLVVIIIIGILAAIAIPIFLNQRKKGVDASIKSDVKQFATQVETFYTDKQRYPNPAVALDYTAQAAAGDDVTVGAETVTVSENNALEYKLGAGGLYTICGSNTNGTAGVWVYEGNGGGLVSDIQAACP